MAIRVRKLAKELKRTPGETLGLLHHLGFPRYKTPNDMVADPIAHKVRKAARSGVTAAAVAFDPSYAPSAQRAPRHAEPDVMSMLVPGVVPHSSAPAAASNADKAPSLPPPAAPPVPVAPAAPTPDVAALERALTEARAERDALREELGALRRVADHAPDGTSVGALLRARGLLGTDEAHRALGELAQARALDAILDGAKLGPHAAATWERELAKLVLLDGAKPDDFGGPAVAVAPERAEAPGGDVLRRLMGKVAEQLLLNGYRQMRFVGIAPRWHRPIRAALDRRVEAHFAPGGERDAARVADDARGVDVVVYAGVPLAPDAHTGAGRTRVVRADESLVGSLDALVAALQADDEG